MTCFCANCVTLLLKLNNIVWETKNRTTRWSPVFSHTSNVWNDTILNAQTNHQCTWQLVHHFYLRYTYSVWCVFNALKRIDTRTRSIYNNYKDQTTYELELTTDMFQSLHVEGRGVWGGGGKVYPWCLCVSDCLVRNKQEHPTRVTEFNELFLVCHQNSH